MFRLMFVDITDESAQLLTGTSLQSNLVAFKVKTSQCAYLYLNKDRAERENYAQKEVWTCMSTGVRTISRTYSGESFGKEADRRTEEGSTTPLDGAPTVPSDGAIGRANSQPPWEQALSTKLVSSNQVCLIRKNNLQRETTAFRTSREDEEEHVWTYLCIRQRWHYPETGMTPLASRCDETTTLLLLLLLELAPGARCYSRAAATSASSFPR
ncbi:hypothetical protein ALC53_11459 [Atta colombica]|uniref:Uncharacterized protein n=1 Tax=Atta colombica TaxID=520822 RepID=A0A195B123_9HYME|nr:hypothetical protein ALC53_11459 [Atta colombica]